MFILIDIIYIVLCLVYTHLSNLRKAFMCVIALTFYVILPVRCASVWRTSKSVRICEMKSIFMLITWLGELSEFYARLNIHTEMCHYSM
jgi:hypothetical protein